MTVPDLVTKIRIALATHSTVTVNCPRPKPLWRVLKKELPVCDVTFDEHAVHVAWKAGEGGSRPMFRLAHAACAWSS